MKVRDSGMPDAETWGGFFNPEAILSKLGLDSTCGDVVDFGCGYGTFAIPAARVVRGTVHAFDIEPEMVETTRQQAQTAGLTHVRAMLRDFVTDGTGLPDAGANYAMLFNILHAEQPELLLREAHRVLAAGGNLAVVHWKPDPSTPRGPALAIRPRPQQCIQWGRQAGFELLPPGVIDLPPYHYGLVLQRANACGR